VRIQSGGPEVKYVDYSDGRAEKSLLEQSMRSGPVTGALDLQQYYLNAQGRETDELLRKLLGRAPITMDEFLKEMRRVSPQAAKA